MSKVMIYSLDVVGTSMAGPAIRYWEFAKALSKNHSVTLYTPNTPDVKPEGFELVSYEHKRLSTEFADCDVIITQRVTPPMAYIANRSNTKIILDAYDPLPLEGLEIYKGRTIRVQNSFNKLLLNEQLLSFKQADAVICASEKQRDLWLGLLMNIGKITPKVYSTDSSLRLLVDVVPFGIQNETPKKTGPGLKDAFKLSSQDKVILWGGGIWNWFDPLTLIRSVHQLSKKRSDIKLIFMGLKHPNEGIKEMEMSIAAVRLAKELGVDDKYVFFNYGWVPYGERQNYLLDATMGASTHFDHLETRFSFRTRMLDYIWSSLPIIATEGDSFAELIAQKNLGKIVTYEDVDALASAIEEIADRDNTEIKKNLHELSSSYHWDHVIEPIEKMIEHLSKTPRRILGISEYRLIFQSYRYSLQSIYNEKGLWPVITNIWMKIYKISTRRF